MPGNVRRRIVAWLAERRRALIEAAPATLEERDVRTWLVRRLPSVLGPAISE